MGSRLRRALVVAVGSSLVLAGPVASAPTEVEVHFSAVGDFSASTGAQSVLSLIGSLDNDATITVGDLSYGATGAEETWCDLVKSKVGQGYPFEMIAGNHESNGQNGNINDFSACLPNQLPGAVGTYGRQYYVDVPAGAPLVRFVMISPALPFPDGTTWSYDAGSPRYQWTAAAIDGARAASIPWVVVGMHKLCLSMGDYGCDIGADLNSLLIAKKVDLVLTGHQHIYQRTKQLATGPGCSAVVPGSFDADCVVDSDASLAKDAGTVFATVGTGGVEHDTVNAGDSEAGYFAVANGAAFGVLDVRVTQDVLDAAFRPATGTFTDAFTITRGLPQPNQPPVAAFTPSCTNLGCSFNGTASSDPDGTIVGYSWNWGDGTAAGSGSTPTHTYAAAGTYSVVLTVTDDDGATDTETASVTVTDPPPVTTLASDAFGRSLASGWGTADVGGAWTNSGSATALNVGGGTGQVRMAAGSGPWLALAGVSSASTDLSGSVALDKVPTGSGLYVSFTGRRIPSAGDYRAKVRYTANGSVSLSLSRTTAAGAETSIAAESVVSGVTMAAGQQLNVRIQVYGSSPTTVRARVWKAGTTEPTTWTKSVTDSTAGLQVAGGVGLYLYLSGSATNAPITASFDDYTAVPGP